MSRRDRTTGIPRQRERASATQEPTFLGMRWGETHWRFLILGGVALIGLLVFGLIGWRWYDENVRQPNSVVLRVEDQEFTLDYFTERLPGFAQANPSLSTGFREPALLTKLEEEAITIILAEERGIDLSEDAVTRWIADDLGVPVGGAGSSFDTLYRQRLRTQGLTNADYRRLARAELADTKLIEALREERGETGRMVTLRVVAVSEEAEAAAIRQRVEDGEDMGTIAQTESLDLESRQQDGLTQPAPPELYTADVQSQITDQPEDALIGPFKVGNNWWVVRIERIQDDGTYSATNRDQLAEVDLADLIDEQRTALDIKQSLTNSDIEWAYRHVDAVAGTTNN
ncbi:MAG: peptidylprolyl isomerase [Dehalococcoidia bacterium]